ncbi:MAG: preprotein translocase subunit YajC [Flammeovirgaceae bacterium]
MIILQSFGSGLVQLFFPIAIVVVAYFFILRPEQRRKKKQTDFVSSLKKGDLVVTAGGLHGKIVLIEETTVTLDVDRGTKVKFDKNSISFEMSSAK